MSTLPLVEVQGPPIPRPADLPAHAAWNDPPFWILTATAPVFGPENVEHGGGTQEDRIHPLRTLLLDAGADPGARPQWRLPRLLSAHVLAGETNGGQGQPTDREQLTIRFAEELPGRRPVQIVQHAIRQLGETRLSLFRTFDRTGDRAGFQHVVVEPLLDGQSEWPDQQRTVINVPRLRLIAGAIEVLAIRSESPWFSDLVSSSKAKISTFEAIQFRLTPDGIEIDAAVPFPGQGKDVRLPGRFLLRPAARGPRLCLLPERLTVEQAKLWTTAWQAATPADNLARSLAGLKVGARHARLPPAFTWRTLLNVNGIKDLSAEVAVPAAELDVRLLSPSGPNGIDGEVTLRPEVYTLAAFDPAGVPPALAGPVGEWKGETRPALVLAAELRASGAGAPSANPTRLLFQAARDSFDASLAATDGRPLAHRCAHDEVSLARSLRLAYGFDEPRPGTPDPERPLLAAFAPLDDGWLQLPVPNFPPPDLNKDLDAASVQPAAGGNVLSGYLRFAHAGELPAVLSAFPLAGSEVAEPLRITEAPWVITVERARAVSIAIGLNPDGASAKLVCAAAALDAPELSTRGLMWISADRPDALEALPRLGAGAGAYFDVPLDTFDVEKNPVVQIAITDLAVHVTRASAGGIDTVTRPRLGLSVAFDLAPGNGWRALAQAGRAALAAAHEALTGSQFKPDTDIPPLPPVRWQRHPRMPLAAAMPMTRGAASAVRPLESRDLVPFVFVPPAALPLSWRDEAVFPAIPPLPRRPVAAWPWPKTAAAAVPDAGIALAALGVPGAELTADAAAASDPWPSLLCAQRFDLPALDEAFATATLPPQAPSNTPPDERETPPPPPVPLAHDWAAMKLFWGEQVRRHQLARVANSYVAGYQRIGGSQPLDVGQLVGGLTWTTSVGFKAPDDAHDPLPYGAATVGRAVAGDDALGGVTQRFRAVGGRLVPVGDGESGADVVRVVGYAPSSFDDGGFLMDSRRSGTKSARDVAGRMLWRPLVVGAGAPAAGVAGLATLRHSLDASGLFAFWFKDLPVAAAGTLALPGGEAVDFGVWQDGKLPRSGFEWRLVPATNAAEIFKRGRDRIPFFGFALEPLRLEACKLAMQTVDGAAAPTGKVESATILVRLHLGPSRAGAIEEANLAMLELVADGDGGALRVNGITARGKLTFVLASAEQGAPRVAVTATCGWSGSKPTFTVTELLVGMFGTDRSFTGATLEAGDGDATIEWKPRDPAKEAAASVAVTAIAVTTGVEPTGEAKAVTTVLDSLILVTPPSAASGGAADAAIRIRLQRGKIVRVRLLDLRLAVDERAAFQELDGALAVTMSSTSVDGLLLPGFPVDGKLSLGLVARVGPIGKDGSMPLTAGYLDGEIVADPGKKPDPMARAAFDRIAFHVAAGAEATGWSGALRFYGSLSLDNAIGWPGIVDAASPQPVPWPGVAPNGRTTVVLDPQVAYSHHADYILDGHALPFDVALALREETNTAVWSIPVVSRHTLAYAKGEGPQIDPFTAVETIAIGAAAAIVPGTPLDDDPLAFAARYRETIKNGQAWGEPLPAMPKAGVGEINTVLRGALGLPFRIAWNGSERRGLFVAGGFAGILAHVDGEEAPLLRLPVLAPLDPADELARQPGTIGQSGAPSVVVAWADGRAARDVIATLRGAVAPASTSEVALRAALLAGSRSSASRGLTPEDTVAAVLVEQSFAEGSDSLSAGDLKTSPFFIAAAVSLARALASLDPVRPPTVLSLLAGSSIPRPQRDSRGLAAAAVVTRRLAMAAGGAVIAAEGPELVTIGETLVVRPWTGPAVADLDEVIPVGQIAGPAFADQVEPRAALLRSGAAGHWRYDAPPLPRIRERVRAATAVRDHDRGFPDRGRGYGLLAEDAPLRWLAGPEEGGMRPFRDADDGLAGLSRTMAMPAHALAVGGAVSRLGLSWFAQTRTPVYLELPLQGVLAPAIPWLAPGAPRPRLPADAELARALRTGTQPILPERATLAAVSDRAGISLARIARFETPLGEIPAFFDSSHARFGRPAQGGSWSARTERTPRPGPLPANRGDAERDRRPCASAILPLAPLDALSGPADTVCGEADADKLGAWSVKMVAAADWDGMVTESWDGTIRVLAEVDVAPAGSPPTDVVGTLFGLLFPRAGDALDVRGDLVIGKTVLPFQRMHVENKLSEPDERAFAPIAGGAVLRGVVKLVLDARPAGDLSRQRGSALADIAAALAVTPPPAVEVRLAVKPGTRPAVEAIAVGAVNLSLERHALPAGDDRAPVTLRLPLSPVVRSRGALPLVPTSILFTDPAYDAGLSSAPGEHRERVPAAVPEGRGALTLSLYADRLRANRRGSVTFMMDLAFEKRLDGPARLLLDKTIDGDIQSSTGNFALQVCVIPKSGERRQLAVGQPSPRPVIGFRPPAAPDVSLAKVYELSLVSLVETDGTAAVLAAGDVLQIVVSEPVVGSVRAVVVVDTAGGVASPGTATIAALDAANPVSRHLEVLLTDEPVVEPPPALYAALVRRATEVTALSLPLYAQSPLPWRVDLRDAKADFRRGLMRRTATFIWTLARPRSERDVTGIYVVKVDRNGQTHLPATEAELVKARVPMVVKA